MISCSIILLVLLILMLSSMPIWKKKKDGMGKNMLSSNEVHHRIQQPHVLEALKNSLLGFLFSGICIGNHMILSAIWNK